MELLPESNASGQDTSLSNGSSSDLGLPRVSMEDSETQNEKTMPQQQKENASNIVEVNSSNKDQEAMLQENGDDIKVEDSNEADDQVSAVTPVSVEEQRPVATTLDETMATNLESPLPETHSNGVANGVKEAQVGSATTEAATTSPVESMDDQDAKAQVPSGQLPMPVESLNGHGPDYEAASHTKPELTDDEAMSSVAQNQQEEAASVTVNEPATKVETSEIACADHGGTEAVVNGSHQSTEVLAEPHQQGIETVDPPVVTSVETAATTGDETMEDIIESIVDDAIQYGQPNDPSAISTRSDQHSDKDDGAQSDTSQLLDTDVEPMEEDGGVPLEGAAGEAGAVANPSAAAAAPSAAASVEVIDLLDSDEEAESGAVAQQFVPPAAKRQRTEEVSAGAASYQQAAVARVPMNHPPPMTEHQRAAYRQQQIEVLSTPKYVNLTPGFVPTWKNLLPPREAPRAQPQQNRMKYYELTLLNVSEFTITGLRVGDDYSGYTTSVAGLRTHIKKISKGHGNAFFERDPDGGTGKWHIPLGAYHSFFGFLDSQPNHHVRGIEPTQLKIASLGKARLEKEYPSARKLIKMGVPKQLADALAPFQRGGVDFVIEKEGRALIADEMGLGKTIQGIASMAVYHEEWPILVLCPSSARYHWENEFRHWLGENSAINDSEHTGAFDGELEENGSEDEADEAQVEPRPAMPLLRNSQINVLTSGQTALFPHAETKVVICSYGLAPNLVTNEKLLPGMFKCAIVDESHMLKNKSTQRTSKLLPVLKATTRCVLLSGTPAFARPLELWPQLQILGTERHGWGQSEQEYIRKYSRGGSRRAELHTLLMGTVMIRRMKNDILKTLPAKVREQGIVDVMDAKTRSEMQQCMVTLRTGKGKLCELARGQKDDVTEQAETPAADDGTNGNHHATANDAHAVAQAQSQAAAAQRELAQAQLDAATHQLRQDIEHRRAQGRARIEHTLASHPSDPEAIHVFRHQMQQHQDQELETYFRTQMHAIQTNIAASSAAGPLSSVAQPEEPPAKKAVLNHMYSLTGKCKIPLVVEMLKRWLADPTKGKLCIFAHHISVLNEIAAGAGLSLAADSTTKYIRIDGSTTPRARQDQINQFQTDATVRIALLGITAAGVAVTLTASSTVWFAELFWTPAIMVQAEDRCHRIGQQARVKCLYFVAKGTLDELLWKLLENKFQDLGEFVEGKEKMKMVVNNTYHSTHELLKTVTPETLDDEGDDSSDANSECSLSPVEELDSDLEHEIEELGLSEQMLLNVDADGDADNDGSDPDSQTESGAKPAAKPSKKDTIGTTEDDAICLSDDEEEDVEVVSDAPAGQQAQESAAAGDSVDATQQAVAKKPAVVSIAQASFPQLRMYTLPFVGESYGLVFSLFENRMVVSGRSEARVKMFGPEAKPHVGDVLVAIAGQLVPPVQEMSPITNYLKKKKSEGVTELMFAEDSEITSRAIVYIASEKERRRQEQVAALAAIAAANPAAFVNGVPVLNGNGVAKPKSGADEVIELD